MPWKEQGLLEEEKKLDFDKLTQKEEFKTIEPEKLAAIKEISEKSKGKSMQEIIKIISSYKELFSSGNKITDEERNLMISVMLENMNEEERKNFAKILKLGGINI